MSHILAICRYFLTWECPFKVVPHKDHPCSFALYEPKRRDANSLLWWTRAAHAVHGSHLSVILHFPNSCGVGQEELFFLGSRGLSFLLCYCIFISFALSTGLWWNVYVSFPYSATANCPETRLPEMAPYIHTCVPYLYHMSVALSHHPHPKRVGWLTGQTWHAV